MWFGEFLHRKSLLQVSLTCCGLRWTSFSLSSIDKHASFPTSPSLQVWCMSSKFLQSYAISICKISNAKCNFKSSFDLHPKSRTYGATVCPDVHPFFAVCCIFCWSLLYWSMSVCGLLRLLSDVGGQQEQRRAKPTGRQPSWFQKQLLCREALEFICRLWVQI